MKEFEFIQNLLQEIENKVIVDIGAADLSHSIAFRKIFGDAKIYSVEPDRFYEKSNEINSGRFDINLTKGVVSNTNGRVLFFPSTSYGKMPVWPGSGSIYKPNHEVIEKKYNGLTFDETGYEVESYTWRGFISLKGIKKVDWLHIDAQGAEFDIINGITECFPEYIWAETCEFDTYHTERTENDFNEMMREKGYTSIYNDGADTFYVRAKQVLEL
jgi:FkbM family methyltransferase